MPTKATPTIKANDTEPLKEALKVDELAGNKPKESLEDILKKGAAKESPTKSAPTTSARKTSIEKGMTDLYERIGEMLMWAGDEHCGNAIMQNAERMGKADARLAAENANMRKFFNRLMETSAMGEFAAAHAPIILAIGVHHSKFVQNRIQAFANRNVPNPDEYTENVQP